MHFISHFSCIPGRLFNTFHVLLSGKFNSHWNNLPQVRLYTFQTAVNYTFEVNCQVSFAYSGELQIHFIKQTTRCKYQSKSTPQSVKVGMYSGVRQKISQSCHAEAQYKKLHMYQQLLLNLQNTATKMKTQRITDWTKCHILCSLFSFSSRCSNYVTFTVCFLLLLFFSHLVIVLIFLITYTPRSAYMSSQSVPFQLHYIKA